MMSDWTLQLIYEIVVCQSEIPLPFDLLEPWDVRALFIRKTADLPLQLWVGTFPRFVAIGLYFLSETLILIASPIIFLFIHNHLTLRKWCCTRLLHDIPLDPIISPFDFLIVPLLQWSNMSIFIAVFSTNVLENAIFLQGLIMNYDVRTLSK